MSGIRREKLGRLICAGILTLALAGGVRQAKANIHKRYFPLNVGNSWTYVDCNDGSTKTFNIIATKDINRHTYYKFDDYFNVLIGEARRTMGSEVLVRFDTDLDAVLMYMDGEDIIRYNFAGGGWTMARQWCRLKQADVTCNVPAGEFSECINFQFVGFDAGPDCYLYGEYLAPNVGLVKYVVPGGECYGCEEKEGDTVTFELENYTIVQEPRCGDANHPYPVGDLNHDCKVNLFDLAILASHWLERVNLEPVVYITEPEDGAVIDYVIDTMCVEADAWDVDGSVVKVEFFIEGIEFAEDNDGTDGWVVCTSPPGPGPGTLSLVAKATDNEGATTTSPPVTITAMEECETVIEVSTTTDKSTYLLGEVVTVFVTAYNPNPESVTLGFGSDLHASYSMDGVFDWAEGRSHLPVALELTIKPCDSFTWDIRHGSCEMAIYPLGVGTHTLVGEVLGYGQSAPAEFQVRSE